MKKDVILIVDDDPDVLEIHRRYIDGLPCEVLATTDADTAWAWIRNPSLSSRIGVVVTDGMMPKRDGVWLARQIHQSGTGIPTILVSASVHWISPDDLHLFSEAIEKPTSLAWWQGHVRRYLEPRVN